MKQVVDNHIDARGFTLVELMVGIALGAIGAAVLFSIFVGTQTMYYDTRDLISDRGDSRVVMSMIAHEIRSAGNDLGTANIQTVAAASDSNIRLLSDLNAQNGIEIGTEPPEDVTYFFSESDKALYRDTGAGPVMLLQDVDVVFEFIDGNGDSLGAGPLSDQERDRVRAVSIHIYKTMSNGTIDAMTSTITIRRG